MTTKKQPKDFVSFWAVFPTVEDAISFLLKLPLEAIELPEAEVVFHEDGSVTCKLCTRIERDKTRAIEHRTKHVGYLAKMCVVCIFLGRPNCKRCWLTEDAWQKHMNKMHDLKIKTLGKWGKGNDREKELYRLMKMYLPLGQWKGDPSFD